MLCAYRITDASEENGSMHVKKGIESRKCERQRHERCDYKALYKERKRQRDDRSSGKRLTSHEKYDHEHGP